MRILFATYAMAFQNPGGGEQLLLSMKSELGRLGVETDLYNPWLHDPADYDVIHYFSCLENAFWEVVKRDYPRKPLVVTPTFYQQSGPKAVAGLVRQLALRELGAGDLARYELPDLWLPNTRIEGERLAAYRRADPSRMKVLSCGLDPAIARGDPALFAGRTGITGPFVLHVARFHRVKRQLALIEVLRESDLDVVFLGAPDLDHQDYYEACRAAAQASPRARFTFLPPVSHGDPFLASAYAAAGVFVLPSEFETFGMAALEAAAAGAPLVLSDRLWSRDIFAPHAELVDPYDPRALRAAIARALGTRDAIALSGSRRELLRRFSWNEIARELLDVYEQLLRGGQARSPSSRAHLG